MFDFQNIPAPWQFAIIAGLAFAVTLLLLWLDTRREKRRKHALELMRLMDQWGLSWFAGLYADYAVGDYSGIAYRIKEVIESVRSDEVMVSKLGEVARKVAGYYAANDPTKAAELIGVLQTTKHVPQNPTA